MQVELAYGCEGLEIELPDDAPVTVVEPRFAPGLPDERAVLIEALRNPIASQPLNDLVTPEDAVAIVFSDLTRPMPNDRVLPPLLEELGASGVPEERIVLINALGAHRPQTEDELASMLGEDVVARYRIVQHDAWDEKKLVVAAHNHAGRAVHVNRAYMNASVRILTGFIEPHFFAGFSGGPKAVLPGIIGIESILDNHGAKMLADSNASWAMTEGNPVWEEMLSVAQSTAPDFLLNVTLNRKREITGVFAGDLLAAHRKGMAFAREMAMQPTSHFFDIVITSNSGYPLDLNLYQAVKGMSAAAQIVRSTDASSSGRGDIIIAAQCWDGIPDHGEYKRLLWEAETPRELLDRVMAPSFRCQDQWEAQIQAQIQLKANVYVYADGLSEEELRNALVIPCRSIEETLARLRHQKPDALIAVLPDGPQTVPYVKT